MKLFLTLFSFFQFLFITSVSSYVLANDNLRWSTTCLNDEIRLTNPDDGVIAVDFYSQYSRLQTATWTDYTQFKAVTLDANKTFYDYGYQLSFVPEQIAILKETGKKGQAGYEVISLVKLKVTSKRPIAFKLSTYKWVNETSVYTTCYEQLEKNGI